MNKYLISTVLALAGTIAVTPTALARTTVPGTETVSLPTPSDGTGKDSKSQSGNTGGTKSTGSTSQSGATEKKK